MPSFGGLNVLCSGGRFVALLWSKNERPPIPLRIIKTHFADNKSDFADDKSEIPKKCLLGLCLECETFLRGVFCPVRFFLKKIKRPARAASYLLL